MEEEEDTRKFTVSSEFGGARAWRSRKSRPCDACRRRKTACIINTSPPCAFCHSRGLPCEASGATPRRRRPPQPPQATAASASSSPPSAGPPGLAIRDGGHLTHILNGEPRPQGPSPPEPPSDSLHTRGPGAIVPPASSSSFAHGLDASPLYRTQHVEATTSPSSGHYPDQRPVERTLEDNEDKTAHSMGLAAEQDVHVLDSFRAVIMSVHGVDAEIIQVQPGDRNHLPVHFCLLQDDFFPHDDAARAQASHRIEEMAGPHGPALVRLYFKHIHPVSPVISKGRFLSRYATDRSRLPPSLRAAVYALASVFWPTDQGDADHDQNHRPPPPLTFEQWEMVDVAHSSLLRELDSPNLDKLQAGLLLLNAKPNDVDTLEHPRIWTQTAQATACAQMIGLHQEPSNWSIAAWEKKLRRKLWWATVVADTWSSVLHGNPPHIYPESFSTTPPHVDDIQFDEEVSPEFSAWLDPPSASYQVATAARFVAMVELTLIVRDILATSFRVPGAPYDSPDGFQGPYQSAAERNKLYALQVKLENWFMLRPQCLAFSGPSSTQGSSMNAPLQLAYFAAQVLLYRGLMGPATKAARVDPNSGLRVHFQAALEMFTEFVAFIAGITQPQLRGYWGRHARAQLILCTNFLIYLFLLASEPEHVVKAFELIESFNEGLCRLKGMAGTPKAISGPRPSPAFSTPTGTLSAAMLLLLPAAVRIESFLEQAPRLMRTRGTSLSQSVPTDQNATPSPFATSQTSP
ncbi:fungal-specific transcription factor domain-containing protein [Microdochium trichocladiopsis]|uniref:Fungal-specific transcription factor domain-containing protein n=1 Tax=Microdochium trichocladiopsis TaxID=1682393 RepID=A0A9P8Y2E3_9PEZI|nr:fungal-specific transcription factor domain-containing protein [Microdochium trichocladiopsis]KAH7027209.1 fungal-specific transcription factor domain-containing protein [Microdochium trichocladiopsis]